MELHALRHLVFNEILGQNKTDQEAVTGSSQAKEEKPVPADICQQPPLRADPEVVENRSRRPAKFSRSEKFYKIAGHFAEMLAPFASFIWHQRKRLRLKKSGELRVLREKCPIEKRAKFKAKRRDFSLEILCRNNLYDNIVRNSASIMNRMEELLSLCRCLRPFSNKRRDVRFVATSKSPLQLVLKRVCPPVYECCVEGKILRLRQKLHSPAPSSAGIGDDIPLVEDVSPQADLKGQTPAVVVKPAIVHHSQSLEPKQTVKKRGRKPKPKVVAEAASSEGAPVAEEPVLVPQRQARKGRPRKIRSELMQQQPAGAPELSSNITALSGGSDIFALHCEDPNISLVTVPKVRKLSEPKMRVTKVRKKCDLLDDLSETEEQVPLKITFKRPSDREFGTKRGKSIKLRVKTQTTKDNGFKIQINQPKTKNPLRFKLKTSSKLFKKSKTSVGKSKEKPKQPPGTESGCSVTVVVPGRCPGFEVYNFKV